MSRTIGTVVDEMAKLHKERAELTAQADDLTKRIGVLEAELLELSDAQNTGTGKGKLASYSIVEKTVPQVKDWDAFWKYIARTKYYHLVERRPSVTGCRELFDTKGSIPGVEKYTFRKVNLRSL